MEIKRLENNINHKYLRLMLLLFLLIVLCSCGGPKKAHQQDLIEVKKDLDNIKETRKGILAELKGVKEIIDVLQEEFPIVRERSECLLYELNEMEDRAENMGTNLEILRKRIDNLELNIQKELDQHRRESRLYTKIIIFCLLLPLLSLPLIFKLSA